MAIDPSIILGLKQPQPLAPTASDPIGDYTKGLTLRALLGQQQLQQVQVQQAQQTLAEDAAYKKVLQDHFSGASAGAPAGAPPAVAATGVQPGTVMPDAVPATPAASSAASALVSPNGIPTAPAVTPAAPASATPQSATLDALIPKLRAQGLMKQADALQKTVDEHAKSEAGTKKDIAETGKVQTEQRIKGLENSASALADVAKLPPAQQQAAYQTAMQLAESLVPGSGATWAKIMPVYNAQQAGQMVAAGTSHAEQMKAQQAKDDAAERARHNKADEGIAGGNLAVSRDRLKFEKDQASATENFTPAAIENAAARYNIDGTLPPMGMGKAGAAGRSAILNRAAELAGQSGVSADDQRINQIGNKANTAALTKLQSQQSMVGAFEKNFNKNADMALELSKQRDSTGVPLVNKWINAGKRAISGDPELSRYDVAIKATVNEYQKIVSGSMGNSPGAQAEIQKVEGLLNSAQNQAQVDAVLGYMKKETQNRMAGFEEEKAQLRGSMKGGGATKGGPVTIKGQDGYNALPSGTEFIAPDGSHRVKP